MRKVETGRLQRWKTAYAWLATQAITKSDVGGTEPEIAAQHLAKQASGNNESIPISREIEMIYPFQLIRRKKVPQVSDSRGRLVQLDSPSMNVAVTQC